MSDQPPTSIEDEISMPRRRKTHRGRRSKGKSAKPDHMAQANQHLQNAHKDPTPQGTTAHLFRALSSLKKASKEGC